MMNSLYRNGKKPIYNVYIYKACAIQNFLYAYMAIGKNR